MTTKKKAKGKVKAEGTTKESTKKKSVKKKRASRSKKPVDIGRLRENINNQVGAAAREIAREVINIAKTGQLASARYLFEAVGLYPATEETAASPVEHTLAHTLLTRMGLPLEPVIFDGELTAAALARIPKDPTAETAEASAPQDSGEDKDGGEGKDEEDAVK